MPLKKTDQQEINNFLQNPEGLSRCSVLDIMKGRLERDENEDMMQTVGSILSAQSEGPWTVLQQTGDIFSGETWRPCIRIVEQNPDLKWGLSKIHMHIQCQRLSFNQKAGV